MKKRLQFLFTFLLAHFFVNAQQATSSIQNLLTHIEGQLLIDAAGKTQNTKFQVNYLSKSDTTNSINLFLSKDFKNVTVNGALIKHYIFDTLAFPLPTLRITLKNALKAGESARFNIAYSGSPSRAFWNAEYDWIDMDTDFMLFPVFTDFHEFTYKLQAEVAGDGYKIIDQQDHKLRNRILIDSKTKKYYFPSFYLSRNLNHTRATKDGYQVNLLTTKPDTASQQMINAAFEMLKFYNAAFGNKAPRRGFTLLQRPLPKKVQPVQKTDIDFIVLASDQEDFETLSHEIAHLWWNRGNHSTMEKWLTESFAEYSRLMFLRHSKGEEEFNKEIKKFEKTIQGLPALLKVQRFGPHGNDMLYFKGPYLLYELEQKIGKDKFTQLLTELNHLNVSDTPTFLEVLQKVTSAEISKAFESKLNND